MISYGSLTGWVAGQNSRRKSNSCPDSTRTSFRRQTHCIYFVVCARHHVIASEIWSIVAAKADCVPFGDASVCPLVCVAGEHAKPL